MSHFVVSPNLPCNAGAVMVGEKYVELLRPPLERIGIDVLPVPDNPYVDERLSGHADLSVFHAGGERIFLAPYLENSGLMRKLENLGANISLLSIKQDRIYPDDAQMNACVLGSNLIYTENITDKNIVSYLTNNEIQGILSRQGYAKCAVCVVDDRSLITADRSIAKAADAAGLEVLLICPGYVGLPGFDYGFIGGTTFKISQNQLAFTGHLEAHPNKTEIFNFLSARDIAPVLLTNEPLFDIGSGIPIQEKQP